MSHKVSIALHVSVCLCLLLSLLWSIIWVLKACQHVISLVVKSWWLQYWKLLGEIYFLTTVHSRSHHTQTADSVALSDYYHSMFDPLKFCDITLSNSPVLFQMC